MPVIAIGGAIIAGVEAAGAVSAVIAGGLGALTVGGALSIVTAVGATLGAIGVVTGDKGLSTAGMILGGIGGIGSLAVGAGIFGEGAGAASVFGSGSAGAADFADAVNVTPEIAGSNVGGFLGTGASGAASAASNDLVDMFGGIKDTPVSVAPLAAPTAGAAPTSSLEGSSSLAGASAADTLTTPSTTDLTGGAGSPPLPTSIAPTVPGAPSTGAIPNAPPVPGSVNVTPQIAGTNAGGYMGDTSSPGLLDAFGNFIKNDKSGMASYGLIQAGGSLISGLFDPLKPAQVANLNAQTAQQKANTGITQMQAANMAAPIPVANRGLINTGAY